MSVIKNLFTPLRRATQIREAQAEQIRTWYRSPGTDEDVWEAHAALTHLHEVTHRENTPNTWMESQEWLLANAYVAEAMSQISWLQEWHVRDAVAAGIAVGDL